MAPAATATTGPRPLLGTAIPVTALTLEDWPVVSMNVAWRPKSCATGGATDTVLERKGASASTRAFALGNRCVRSAAMASRTTSMSPIGRPGRSDSMGVDDPVVMRIASASSVGASNGRVPVSASKSTTPSEKTSVRTSMSVEPKNLFARHVRRASDDHPRPSALEVSRRRRRLGELRHAEIEDLHERPAVACRHEEVVRLEVPVDDARPVRRGDALGGLRHQIGRAGHGQRPFALEDLPERLALEHLHDQIRLARRQRARVERLDQVRAAGATGGRRLVQKAADDVRVLHDVRVQQLEGTPVVRELVLESRRPRPSLPPRARARCGTCPRAAYRGEARSRSRVRPTGS